MKSLAELQAIRDKMKCQMSLRTSNDQKTKVTVCMATCGISAGARPVLNAITNEIAKRDLDTVAVFQTGCIGICQYEPIVEVVTPDGKKTTYVKMTEEKAVKVVAEHLVNGNPIPEYTLDGAAK